MAIVKKKIKGKEYLYEVRYENGKQKWKYLGRASDSILNGKEASRELKSEKESHKRLVITRSRVQIPPAACFFNLEPKEKNFEGRFPFRSSFDSVQSWIESFMAFYNYWRFSLDTIHTI